MFSTSIAPSAGSAGAAGPASAPLRRKATWPRTLAQPLKGKGAEGAARRPSAGSSSGSSTSLGGSARGKASASAGESAAAVDNGLAELEAIEAAVEVRGPSPSPSRHSLARGPGEGPLS